VVIEPANNLLLTGNGEHRPVLGMRGMEVREGSGEKGFFQVRCIRGAIFNIMIGLGTHDVDLNRGLGSGHEGMCWCVISRGKGYLILHNSLRGISPDEGRVIPGHDYRVVSVPKFEDGDVVGIMVDCSEAPTLRLFVNGAQVRQMVMTQQMHGKVIFPAFALGDAQIDISPNPDLPADV